MIIRPTSEVAETGMTFESNKPEKAETISQLTGKMVHNG